MDKHKQTIVQIKQKRELSGIDDSIVIGALDSYLKKNNLSLDALKAPHIKLLVKDIRAELRCSAGMFQTSHKNREKLLQSGKIESILKTHSSTKERFAFYPELRKLLETLKVTSILDLGCVLNPIALAKPEVTYYASDINLSELEIIKEFFSKNSIKGKTFFCDLRKIEECPLPSADVCLIFKVFDILGKNDYLLAERVLKMVSSRHILASFSTITLSGKPMQSPRRIWFEKLIRNLNLNFEIISSPNEIFYLIRRE
jgi:SAM-dependent methyltransferase